MGKWLKMSLVVLAVLMTATLAFGQEGEFYSPEPSGQAGPAQQLGPDVWPKQTAGAPGCDQLPLGDSREDTQKSAAQVLGGQFAPKNHKHPEYALKGHSHGGGKTSGHGGHKPSATERQVANQQTLSQTMYVVLPSGQIVAATGSGALPPTPTASPPVNPGQAGNSAPTGASGGSGMTPLGWTIIAIIAIVALLYGLNSRTNRDADARAARAEERRLRAEERAENRRDEDDAAVRYGTRLASAGYGAKPGILGPLKMRSFMIQRGPNGRADGVEWYETAEGRVETLDDQDVAVMDPGHSTRIERRRGERPVQRRIEDGPADRNGITAQGGPTPREVVPDAEAAGRAAGREAGGGAV